MGGVFSSNLDHPTAAWLRCLGQIGAEPKPDWTMASYGYSPPTTPIVPKEAAKYILATAKLKTEHDPTSTMPDTAEDFVAVLSAGGGEGKPPPCFTPLDPPLACTAPQMALLAGLIKAYNAATTGEARFGIIAAFMAEAVAAEAATPQKIGDEGFLCSRYDIYKVSGSDGTTAVFAECFPWGDKAHGKTLALGVLRWARFQAKLIDLKPEFSKTPQELDAALKAALS